MEGLAGKSVLVTGGSSGIGEACARRLAAEGCQVMVAGRDEVKTRAVARSLLPVGRHGWVTGDVRDVGDCRALVTATTERFGAIDVLVHCAGVWDERPTLSVSEEDWDTVVDTCLKGAFFTMQAALGADDRGRRRRDRGHRQRLRSPRRARRRSLRRRQGRAHQRRAHAGARPRPDGVRVCAVSPGIIETPMLDAAVAAAGDPEAYAGWQPHDYPVGRFGKPARGGLRRGLPRFDEATFVTGRTWVVDGGVLRVTVAAPRAGAGADRGTRRMEHASKRAAALVADACCCSASRSSGAATSCSSSRRSSAPASSPAGSIVAGTMLYLVLRYVVATGIFAAAQPKSWLQAGRRDWAMGGLLGAFYLTALILQTIGLQRTSPGVSGFITGMSVAMVPFLYWAVARRSPGKWQIIGAIDRHRRPRRALAAGRLHAQVGRRHHARRHASSTRCTS